MTSSPIDSYFKSRSTFYSLQYFCKDSQLLTACLAIFIICATFVAPEKLASCMLHWVTWNVCNPVTVNQTNFPITDTVGLKDTASHLRSLIDLAGKKPEHSLYKWGGIS